MGSPAQTGPWASFVWRLVTLFLICILMRTREIQATASPSLSPTCYIPDLADFFWVIDQSSSIARNPGPMRQFLQFIEDFTGTRTMSPVATRQLFVQFAGRSVVSPLHQLIGNYINITSPEASTADDFINFLANMTFAGGTTNIAGVMDFVRTTLITDESFRPGSKRYVILATDAGPTDVTGIPTFATSAEESVTQLVLEDHVSFYFVKTGSSYPDNFLVNQSAAQYNLDNSTTTGFMESLFCTTAPAPSIGPSRAPSETPSTMPSISPSTTPSVSAPPTTSSPSIAPSHVPSLPPSTSPSSSPLSSRPSFRPSLSPSTSQPSSAPTCYLPPDADYFWLLDGSESLRIVPSDFANMIMFVSEMANGRSFGGIGQTRMAFAIFSGPLVPYIIDYPLIGTNLNITDDAAAIQANFTAILSTLVAPGGQTDIAGALNYVRQSMVTDDNYRPGSTRYVILVSDGLATDDLGFVVEDSGPATAAAQALKDEDGVRFATVFFNNLSDPNYLEDQTDTIYRVDTTGELSASVFSQLLCTPRPTSIPTNSPSDSPDILSFSSLTSSLTFTPSDSPSQAPLTSTNASRTPSRTPSQTPSASSKPSDIPLITHPSRSPSRNPETMATSKNPIPLNTEDEQAFSLMSELLKRSTWKECNRTGSSVDPCDVCYQPSDDHAVQCDVMFVSARRMSSTEGAKERVLQESTNSAKERRIVGLKLRNLGIRAAPSGDIFRKFSSLKLLDLTSDPNSISSNELRLPPGQCLDSSFCDQMAVECKFPPALTLCAKASSQALSVPIIVGISFGMVAVVLLIILVVIIRYQQISTIAFKKAYSAEVVGTEIVDRAEVKGNAWTQKFDDQSGAVYAVNDRTGEFVFSPPQDADERLSQRSWRDRLPAWFRGTKSLVPTSKLQNATNDDANNTQAMMTIHLGLAPSPTAPTDVFAASPRTPQCVSPRKDDIGVSPWSSARKATYLGSPFPTPKPLPVRHLPLSPKTSKSGDEKWLAIRDEDSNETYWINTFTGEFSWVNPTFHA